MRAFADQQAAVAIPFDLLASLVTDWQCGRKASTDTRDLVADVAARWHRPATAPTYWRCESCNQLWNVRRPIALAPPSLESLLSCA